MSENDAYALEIERIKFYGRIDLGTGILRNRTNGGEGVSGHRHSQETRDRMSAAQTGKKRADFSQEHRVKMSATKTGKKRAPFSQEHRDRMSAANSGRIRSQETRDRMSAANTGKHQSAEHTAKLTEARRKNKAAKAAVNSSH